MAKRRKGRRRSSAPLKRASVKGRRAGSRGVSRARSIAARKGWETRRKQEAQRTRTVRKIERTRRTRTVKVPDVIGEALADARYILEERGLRVGTVTKEGPPPRVVAWQRPKKGSTVPLKTRVDLHLLGVEQEDAKEWEFGFVYGERHHGIDVNVRVARRDGRAMPETEARAVMTRFRETQGKVLPGYIVHGVQWSKPGKRYGRERPLGDLVDSQLASVLDAVAGDKDLWELRVGSVKR